MQVRFIRALCRSYVGEGEEEVDRRFCIIGFLQWTLTKRSTERLVPSYGARKDSYLSLPSHLAGCEVGRRLGAVVVTSHIINCAHMKKLCLSQAILGIPFP
jgi:hypothetical protein